MVKTTHLYSYSYMVHPFIDEIFSKSLGESSETRCTLPQPAVLMDGASPRSIQASEQRLEAGALGGLKTGNKKPET